MTDDSYVTQVIKIVPVTKDTDIFCKNVDMNKDIGPCSSAMVDDVTQVLKIAPDTTDPDGLHTSEYDCRDWFADVKSDNLQDIKEEPKDVRYTVFI